jgi:hypothetical protein
MFKSLSFSNQDKKNPVIRNRSLFSSFLNQDNEIINEKKDKEDYIIQNLKKYTDDTITKLNNELSCIFDYHTLTSENYNFIYNNTIKYLYLRANYYYDDGADKYLYLEENNDIKFKYYKQIVNLCASFLTKLLEEYDDRYNNNDDNDKYIFELIITIGNNYHTDCSNLLNKFNENEQFIVNNIRFNNKYLRKQVINYFNHNSISNDKYLQYIIDVIHSNNIIDEAYKYFECNMNNIKNDKEYDFYITNLYNNSSNGDQYNEHIFVYYIINCNNEYEQYFQKHMYYIITNYDPDYIKTLIYNTIEQYNNYVSQPFNILYSRYKNVIKYFDKYME